MHLYMVLVFVSSLGLEAPQDWLYSVLVLQLPVLVLVLRKNLVYKIY